jgi:hypothetical protein
MSRRALILFVGLCLFCSAAFVLYSSYISLRLVGSSLSFKTSPHWILMLMGLYSIAHYLLCILVYGAVFISLRQRKLQRIDWMAKGLICSGILDLLMILAPQGFWEYRYLYYSSFRFIGIWGNFNFLPYGVAGVFLGLALFVFREG